MLTKTSCHYYSFAIYQLIIHLTNNLSLIIIVCAFKVYHTNFHINIIILSNHIKKLFGLQENNMQILYNLTY